MQEISKIEAAVAKLTQPHHSADTWYVLLMRNKPLLLTHNQKRPRNTRDEKQGQDKLARKF